MPADIVLALHDLHAHGACGAFDNQHRAFDVDRVYLRTDVTMSKRFAARVTLDEIAAGAFEVHYPKRFTLGLKLLRLLPYRLQFAAVRRLTGG